MITRTLLATLVLAISTAAVAQDLPGVDDVINKYYEACGGKAKMEAVTTQVQKGRLILSDMGMEAEYTSYNKQPNNVNISSFDGMGVVKNGLSNGYTYSVNPFQGNTVQKSDDPGLIFPLLYWKLGGGTFKVSGEGEVNGEKTWVVAMTDAKGVASELSFAQDSGLLVQLKAANGTVSKLGDYKDVDGVKVAHEITQEGGELNIKIVIDSTENNAEISDEMVAMPEEVKALITD